jgi:hypothetical protein
MLTDVSALLVGAFFAGLFASFFVSKNEGSIFLRNVGGILRDIQEVVLFRSGNIISAVRTSNPMCPYFFLNISSS